jgi:nitrile hydratase accessory protein
VTAPAFGAPWQARAFAMVRALQDAGVVTAREWADALGAAIRDAGDGADPDDYYGHWLGALERLVVTRELTTGSALSDCRTAWADAARRTPHGAPIELH